LTPSTRRRAAWSSRTAKGEQIKIIAGDEVKNFDQIKVGDQVVATYTQELMMTLKKGGGALRQRIDSSDQGTAAPGQKPAAFEAKEVAFIADVQQVDLKKQTVTLRGAQRTVRLKIKDPEQLKLIKKGDQVEGVFAEADCRRGDTGTRQGQEIALASTSNDSLRAIHRIDAVSRSA
jgi:Cu/Ag efflux protein CusF